jgi:hypothetical protein
VAESVLSGLLRRHPLKGGLVHVMNALDNIADEVGKKEM